MTKGLLVVHLFNFIQSELLLKYSPSHISFAISWMKMFSWRVKSTGSTKRKLNDIILPQECQVYLAILRSVNRIAEDLHGITRTVRSPAELLPQSAPRTRLLFTQLYPFCTTLYILLDSLYIAFLHSHFPPSLNRNTFTSITSQTVLTTQSPAIPDNSVHSCMIRISNFISCHWIKFCHVICSTNLCQSLLTNVAVRLTTRT